MNCMSLWISHTLLPKIGRRKSMCERCVRACNAIGELTAEFGDTVMIVNVTGYPTAEGDRAVFVENNRHTNLKGVFDGETLVDCLEAAVTAKRAQGGLTR